MQTNTDIDNVYLVTGIKHNLTPGNFKTTLTVTPRKAYGVYESVLNTFESYLNTDLSSLENDIQELKRIKAKKQKIVDC